MRQAMQNLVIILLFGLLNLPKTTPCVAVYGQCDGLQYTGETTCCEGSTCEFNNIWYSQCLPSTAPSNTNCNSVWSQCGGQNWSGATCCVNSLCVYSNPYYSQCLTASATTVSTSIQSTTSTTTILASTQSTTSISTSTQSTTSSTTSSNAGQSSGSTSTGCTSLWSQCGGQNWSGPTCCVNSVCVYSNPYYSQCLQSGEPVTTASTASSSSSNSGSGSGATTVSSGNGNGQAGITTRYWDCCKPSCGWPGKAFVTSPVQTCAQNGSTPVDDNTQSACTGGSAYMCNNQQPWNVSSTLSYGYAAAYISGQSESDWCCACYSLIFTSGPVVGKELIVQVTNTGGDLGANQFDLAMPGGGFGIFDGCTSEFGSGYSWGAQYGGVSQRSDCNNLPTVLQPGCFWRFDWFQNADNPTISFTQVSCPSALTANTHCIRV